MNKKWAASRLFLIFVIAFILKLIVSQLLSDSETSNTSINNEAALEIVGNFKLVDIFDTGTPIRSFYNETIYPPGVVLNVHGGIGNQLWQYACSYALAKRKGWPLYLQYNYDPSHKRSSKRKFQPTQREFAVDKFYIKLDNVIDSKLTKFPKGEPVQITDEHIFNDTLPPGNHLFKHSQECHSEIYWKEYAPEIMEMYQPRLESLNFQRINKFLKNIQNSESVAVHVRRKDFVPLVGFYTPISYQRRAILLMVEILSKQRGKAKPKFFIFSDDIPHTKKKFKDFTKKFEFIFVSEGGTTSIEDFYLMTSCKHIIIPNSTFSWWAAYLIKNKNKIVIASTSNPKYLTNMNKNQQNKRTPLYGKSKLVKDWIVINPFTGRLPTSNEYINKSVFSVL